jgi:hypothetical protein
MKKILIEINFILSFFALAVDTDVTPFWLCMAGLGYFLMSGWLFIKKCQNKK